MLGIIGGTGLTAFADLKITRREIIRTPYGEPSGPVTLGEVSGRTLAFLPRHGSGHTIPPHAVNYRANIWALHSVGVRNIVAVSAVGSITPGLNSGDIVLPDQLIDYTYGRKHTFFDGHECQELAAVKHVDFTEPYSVEIRALCLQAAERAKIHMINGGVYAAMQGPRLETAAEINRLERDGATIVGMTGMPECALARELEMRYAAICPVANHAAGRGDSRHEVSYEEMGKTLRQTIGQICSIIEQVVIMHGD
jgi:5'-methylthioinosine phosphorylase